MRRQDLEHVIRAAAAISGDPDIVVVGSQAILGAYPDAPASMLRSVDADVFPRNRPDLAELVAGSIGEDSMFHETFGYYAHGVGPTTAVSPRGWEQRLVPVRNANTNGATGWCLEPHDLVVSKCVRGDEGDVRFLHEALRHRLVGAQTLRDRAGLLGVDDAVIHRVTERIDGAERALAGPPRLA